MARGEERSGSVSTRRARRKRLLAVALLGLVVVLSASMLAGVGRTAGAAPLQVTPTPPLTPTAPPPEPPATIPVYAGATLQAVESATVNSRQATTWAYTVSGPRVTLAEVVRFYEQEMPGNGWVLRAAEQVQGTHPATVLIYHQPEEPGAPPPHHYKQVAIIAAEATNQANPHKIGFAITLVK